MTLNTKGSGPHAGEDSFPEGVTFKTEDLIRKSEGVGSYKDREL